MGVQIQKLLITLVLVVACSQTGSCEIEEEVNKLMSAVDAIDQEIDGVIKETPADQVLKTAKIYSSLQSKLTSILDELTKTPSKICDAKNKLFTIAYSKVKIVSKAGMVLSDLSLLKIKPGSVISEDSTRNEPLWKLIFHGDDEKFDIGSLNIEARLCVDNIEYSHDHIVVLEIGNWLDKRRPEVWKLTPVDGEEGTYYIHWRDKVLQSNLTEKTVTVEKQSDHANQKWKVEIQPV